MSTIEEKAYKILKKGVMPADERNIRTFRKLIQNYSLVTCFSFACGIGAAFPIAELSVKTKEEQTKRTPAIYSDPPAFIPPHTH